VKINLLLVYCSEHAKPDVIDPLLAVPDDAAIPGANPMVVDVNPSFTACVLMIKTSSRTYFSRTS
jgi:hypothetical protein